MAEQDSGQERTESPTPKRLDDARKKGQVLRSRELNTMVSMLGVSAAVWFLGADLGAGIASSTRRLLVIEREFTQDKALAYARAVEAMSDALLMQLPLFVAMAAVAVLGPVVLGGIRFSAESLGLKLEHLDPIKGLGRMFSPNSLHRMRSAGLCRSARSRRSRRGYWTFSATPCSRWGRWRKTSG